MIQRSLVFMLTPNVEVTGGRPAVRLTAQLGVPRVAPER